MDSNASESDSNCESDCDCWCLLKNYHLARDWEGVCCNSTDHYYGDLCFRSENFFLLNKSHYCNLDTEMRKMSTHMPIIEKKNYLKILINNYYYKNDVFGFLVTKKLFFDKMTIVAVKCVQYRVK